MTPDWWCYMLSPSAPPLASGRRAIRHRCCAVAVEAGPPRRRHLDHDCYGRSRRSAHTVVEDCSRLGSRPPARASLGIMDPIGGPHCDEADALSPHCGSVGAGGAWAASGAGRSGADLNAEHPARHQYHQPPLNILAAVAGTSHSRSQSRCTTYVTALTTQHCRSWHACVVARSGRSAGPATGPTADQHHWTGR